MRHALRERVLALIDQLAFGGRDDRERDELLFDLATFQRDRVEAYARLWASRGRVDGRAPALPTDVFRFARVATFPPRAERRVFLTSGTTSGVRGRHPFRDLTLYDRAAEAAARYALFPDVERLRLILLAPHPAEAPTSSLSYMLGRFEDWFGRDARWVWQSDRLDVNALVAALTDAEREGAPVALLGTSFAFVHAEDQLSDQRWRLADGSRIMTTGGTKGRSREIDPDGLRRALAGRYRVPEALVIGEYGMTELSSQLYEDPLRRAVRGGEGGPRRFWAPGWVRPVAVDPESLAPLPPGELGVLRIDDAANLDSVAAVQTSDLGIVHPGGTVEVYGRAPGALPRGCSLAIEEALRDE